MISRDDQSIRRILTFPAVRSCGAVSPVTLLDSLIHLSRKICGYKSISFSSNGRIARQSIRLIGILLVFFEEITLRRSILSDSVVLCLSELHFAFQKFHFLLEDFTRYGARLWLLMNSEIVSGQFRVLVRAMATALDVLPLDSIDVSVEVKESVELVMRQARKLRFQVHSDDKSACEKVVSILGGLEGGKVAEPSDLKWVLDQLGIRSWVQCNREIKFLDSEIGLEYSTADKRDLVLLKDLMALMCYCRGLLFDVVDNKATERSETRAIGGSNEVPIGLNPDEFRCPISLDFMTDPVTVATGHTYDRSSILKWFSAGNATCPNTGAKLTTTEVVPNLVLRRLIRQYCSANGRPVAESRGRSRDITRTVLPGSPAAHEATRMLGEFLVGRIAGGTLAEKNKAAFEVRLLTKASIFNRSCLVDAGVIPHLLNLLSSTDPSAQENGIAALLNLSKYSQSRAILVENGGLEVIILKVLKEGLKKEAKQHAAGTLFYLASVEEYRSLIGEMPEAIPALMELLRDGTDRGQKNALVAIFRLLMYPANHCRVLAAGLVPLLINLLMSFQREDLIIDSLAVLATLAEKLDGAMAILNAGALPPILGVLSSSTSRAGKEYCVALLLALCINGGAEVVQFLVKSQTLMGQLYSLISDGTSHASKKAASLIRILHEFQEKASSGLVAPVLPQQQFFVHVW